MNTEEKSTRFLVLEAVRAFPRSNPSQITELVPGATLHTVKQMCLTLYEEGHFERELGQYTSGRANGRRPYVYWIAETQTPHVRTVQPRKHKVPTEAGLQAQISSLQARISELEQWRLAAIERYPDLLVPDVVIQARKIVAEQFKETGDHGGVQQVLAGHRDTTMLMKAVISALEQSK